MSERPHYYLAKQVEDFIEIRDYFESKWISTSTKISDASFANNFGALMFNKLLGYINGQNNRSEKIIMTAPVVNEFKNLREGVIDINSACKMTMKMYIPRELSASPPKPTDSNLSLQAEPEFKVAVIKYWGKPCMENYIYNRNKLVDRLGDEAMRFDCRNFMTAEYDPPFRNFAYNGSSVHITSSRPNEIWLRSITHPIDYSKNNENNDNNY